MDIPENTTVIGSPASEYNLPAYLHFNTQKSLFDYNKTEYSNCITRIKKQANCTMEEGGYNFMLNAFAQQQKEGKIKDVPKRESMKITIFKPFRIEKYE